MHPPGETRDTPPAWAATSMLARLLVFVALLLVAVGGPARAQDIYTITVPVDVTADNAVAARDQAVLQGQLSGLEKLMQRMAMRDDHEMLPQVTPEAVVDFVRSLEIRNERTSQVRYLADLRIEYAPDAVRRLMAQAGVRFAETQSRPVLVLPIYRVGETVKLWDEPNPWFIAWASLPQQQDLVPMIVPIGDISDVTEVAGDRSIIEDKPRLLAIAARYGAADVMLARATVTREADPASVQVRADRIGGVERPRIVDRAYAGKNAQSLDVLLNRIALEIANSVEEQWKNENLISAGFEQLLPVTVPIQELSDWVRVRRQLGEVPIVRRHRVLSVTRNRAYLQLAFQGTMDQLKLALSQHGLRMDPGRGEWLLSAPDEPEIPPQPAPQPPPGQ